MGGSYLVLGYFFPQKTLTIGNRINQIIHKNGTYIGFGRRFPADAAAANDLVRFCSAHPTEACPGIALASPVIEFRDKEVYLEKENASQKRSLL